MKTGSTNAKLSLIAGAALAVTAVGALAQGTSVVPTPPAPSALPAPPVPPTPPAPPAAHMGQQIVIVERRGSEDGQQHVRTITRDGKTFVFKTDKPLSDAEVEARIAQAEAGIPPVPRVPPIPPMAGKGEHRIQQRVIVIDGENEGVTDIVSEEGGRCSGKNALSNVDTSEEGDGKITRVRIRTCAGSEAEIERHAMSQAIEGIRQARAEIARDKSLSESIRKQVMDELDAELAKLKAKG
ncbi:hypothetical protein [Novosphingobium sp. B1]|uniref:hypothetical protein n=1 Tax=Novosphingobium sp. B1 TaxID=1938756 RepID=UPI0009D8A7D2|nr:hypothetical protein [Novosphingobium sp. B1]SMC32611.1 hypothetical protein SAMN06272759_101526 [Novosphingobium sp. B1]